VPDAPGTLSSVAPVGGTVNDWDPDDDSKSIDIQIANPPQVSKRSVSLKIAVIRTPGGRRFRTTGVVTAGDAYQPCFGRVTVVIQRIPPRHKNWRLVKTTTTGPAGGFVARTGVVHSPYRAVALPGSIGSHVCAQALSRSVQH
jgi:hypothetical protein